MTKNISTLTLIGTDPKSNANKPKIKGNLLGQVFTPNNVASRMIKNLISDEDQNRSYTILDPCSGPMTFEKAWLASKHFNSKAKFKLIEYDDEFIEDFTSLVAQSNFQNFSMSWGDFLLDFNSDEKFDYLIMNPPYIRQEWIENKHELIDSFIEKYNVKIPGTSNLYVYFIVKSVLSLKVGGHFSIIIYDSWEKTLYGKWLKEFLFKNSEDFQVEHVSGQPFKGRLIDATIITGNRCKEKKLEVEKVKESSDSLFSEIIGFSPISKLFYTKRGLRLKQVSFFMGEKADLKNGAIPFLKKITKVKGHFADSSHSETAYIVSKNYPAIEKTMIVLNKRLEAAKYKPDKNQSILNWVNSCPENWFIQRDPLFAPIVFNYYLRNRPSHIYVKDLHHSDNFYGLIPKHKGTELAYLAVLNSTAVCAEILAHSRNQGGKLAKIQLFEFRKVAIPDLNFIDRKSHLKLEELGKKLISCKKRPSSIYEDIDSAIFEIWPSELLNPQNIEKTYRKIDNKVKKKECL